MDFTILAGSAKRLAGTPSRTGSRQYEKIRCSRTGWSFVWQGLKESNPH